MEQSKNKGAYIFLFLFVGGFIAYSVYQKFLLNRKGIYTIGQYKGSTSGGRQGGSDYYYFYYDGIYYEQGIKIIRSKIRKYYYCKFVPSHPETIRVLYDIDVPLCATPEIVPKRGWSELPKIKCDESKQSLYHDRVDLATR